MHLVKLLLLLHAPCSFLSLMFFIIGIGMLTMSALMMLCFGVIGGRLAYRLRDSMFRCEQTNGGVWCLWGCWCGICALGLKLADEHH